ncbi:MAG: hypothetical protein AB2552_17575 [Candidatus Thiodiazotropha endolucinida]
MPDRKDKKRDAPISIRVTPEEKKQLFANAAKAGLSLSAYMKKLALDVDPPRQSRRPSLNQKILAKLSPYFAKNRDQLDRIEALGGEHGNTPLMQEAVATLNEIRTILMKESGRRS